jgi:hypothetical protein
MAYTTINKGSSYFNTKLYTGNGGTNAITGVGFAPDWVWVKDRTSANSHGLFDVIRGATNALLSNTTNATVTNANYLQSFNSDGFTLGSEGAFNTNTNLYASWNWLANGTGVSNTSGSITSTVSANTTSGFSIVSYTGTGANATVGHGLGVAPDMIIFKNRSSAVNWSVYARPNGAGYGQFLNTTAAKDLDSTYFNNTDPTTSLFSVGSNSFTNGSGNNMIAYCFDSIKGFSKIGSYTGNGSADGTFIYTGFKPSFVMVKRSDSTGSWLIHDNKRNTFNVANLWLGANLSNAETTSSDESKDFLSNGWKIRGTGTAQNTSGGTYIYMAFAENPFVSSTQIPTTAR